MTKLLNIISEETDYFLDDVCSYCLVNDDTHEGKCKCGQQTPLSLIIPNQFNWEFTESIINTFIKFNGLRILGKYVGNKPEELKLLNHLEYLYLSRYKDFDFSYLSNFKKLKSLALDFLRLTNLDGLNGLKQLESLAIIECQKLSCIKGIKDLSSLKVLSISICNNLIDLTPLNNLSALEYLSLECKSLSSLKELSIKNLKILNFAYETRIKDKDITPLYNFENLKHISFKKNLFKSSDINEFVFKNPDCEVKIL